MINENCGLLTVFGDIVEIVSANDNRAGHFGGDNTSSQDTTTDGDISSERALLVYMNREFWIQ